MRLDVPVLGSPFQHKLVVLLGVNRKLQGKALSPLNHLIVHDAWHQALVSYPGPFLQRTSHIPGSSESQRSYGYQYSSSSLYPPANRSHGTAGTIRPECQYVTVRYPPLPSDGAPRVVTEVSIISPHGRTCIVRSTIRIQCCKEK